jgi:anthranilate 1,2-dioxygenase small subunit
MIAIEQYLLVLDLFGRYANALDEERLDDWLALFEEDARYHVLSRENFERKLPLALLQLDSKDMMRDRVLSLRQANVTNIHRDQHLTGQPVVTAIDGERFSAVTGYAMYTTNPEGRSALFGVGSYRDILRIHDGRASFIERLVIVDTFAIPNMLSTPI